MTQIFHKEVQMYLVVKSKDYQSQEQSQEIRKYIYLMIHLVLLIIKQIMCLEKN